jgi:dTDP-4-amino-4,6-dideoxygalactose transaminase
LIFVTKSYLPDREKLQKRIDSIYSNCRLTNNGPLVRELKEKLEEYLGVSSLLLVANGTLALQIAYKTLGVQAKAVTTPFSYVATVSSMVWEGITPEFCDIDPQTFCMNPALLNSEDTAVVPVHVFGSPCDVEALDKTDRKVIYDAAHAFGVKFKGESILKYGNASALSFHATKIFHTVEGGAVIFKDSKDYEKAGRLINFGQNSSGEIIEAGINCKMNEFQAAVGLCVLEDIDFIIEKRGEICQRYTDKLGGILQLQKTGHDTVLNYSYFPVVFETEKQLLKTICVLEENGISPRRYFHPSLNKLGYTGGTAPFSESLSERILCLPLYAELSMGDADKIIRLIAGSL